MCQPKDKGGKRCAAHMSGSLATVSMGSIMSGIAEPFVRKVFSALNKEGKHLPQPTEDEIIAFARNNQFISRHDVTIPDSKRAMLVKRWQKAEMERPSGGTFHAWKHTLVESVVRWRRTASVAALGGVIAFTSACSGGAINDNNSPAPTSSPTSISQTATPSAAPSIPASIGKPAPAGKPVTTPNGKYLQSTISNDDPAMQLHPEILDASTSSYSAADIKAAQGTIVKFTAEEGIDSTLNGGGENVDQWWAKNKNRFSPKYQKEIYDTLKSDRPFVMNEAWQKQYKGKYNYITSPDKPRVYDRKITPKVVWSPAPGSLAVQMDISYKMPAAPNVGKTGTGIQTTTGTMTYSVSKGANGEWLIDGFQHETKTIEG